MIHMSHYRNNRSSWFQIFFQILIHLYGFGYICTYKFYLITKFFSHNLQGFPIQALVEGYHHAQRHTGRYNFSSEKHSSCCPTHLRLQIR